VTKKNGTKTILVIAAIAQILLGLLLVYQAGFVQGRVFTPKTNDLFQGQNGFMQVDFSPPSATISTSDSQTFTVYMMDTSGNPIPDDYANFVWSVDGNTVFSGDAGAESYAVSGSIGAGTHSIECDVSNYVAGVSWDTAPCTAILTVTDSQPTATPTPSPTPTSDPTPTSTPTNQPTSSPTPTPTGSPSPTSTPHPTATPTPTPTPTQQPTTNHILYYAVIPTDGATLNINPAEDSNGYPAGTVVTCTWSSNNYFQKWTLDGSDYTTTSIQVTMNQDHYLILHMQTTTPTPTPNPFQPTPTPNPSQNPTPTPNPTPEPTPVWLNPTPIPNQGNGGNGPTPSPNPWATQTPTPTYNPNTTPTPTPLTNRLNEVLIFVGVTLCLSGVVTANYARKP
jgi:hypothetical protein